MTLVQIRRQTRRQQTVSIDLRTPSGRVLPF